MNDQVKGRAHWSFWVIAVAALVWNAMGVMNYMMQMNAEALASYPESHRAIIDGRPAWATGGFAIAVFGGVLGCVLLLLRKSVAYYLFLASLLGVIVTMIHTVGVAGSFGLFDISMMIVSPVLVAALLVWYAKWTEGRGWIK